MAKLPEFQASIIRTTEDTEDKERTFDEIGKGFSFRSIAAHLRAVHAAEKMGLRFDVNGQVGASPINVIGTTERIIKRDEVIVTTDLSLDPHTEEYLRMVRPEDLPYVRASTRRAIITSVATPPVRN